jgi:hypothetical protein
MTTLNQIDFLRQVHFRSIGLSILSARQPFRSSKIDADVRKAKKENTEIDTYIKSYADKADFDLMFNNWEEIPF